MATLVAVVFDGSSRSCEENGIQVNNAYIVCSKVLVNVRALPDARCY